MEYKYRLVVFVNKKKTKEIEIVPSSWIYSDKLSSTLLCKFMPGPYNNEKIDKLVHMVKNGLLPENQWSSYPIELKGRAYTYEDAEKKAIILEKEPYVYSTDNEDRAKLKANQDKKYFQFKSISQESVSQQLDESNFDINSDIIQNIHNNLKKREKKKQDLSKSPKDEVSPSSNDLSDCSFSSKFSDNENTTSKLGNARNISTILSDNENFEINDNSKQITDCNEKHITKSQNTCGTEVNKKNENVLLFETNNNTEEDRLCYMVEKYYRSLSKQISNIPGQIVNMSLMMKENQQSLEIMLKERNIDDIYSDSNDDEISLPLTNYKEFETLNTKLNEASFRQKIIRRLYNLINRKTTVTRNVGEILRIYFSQDLAIKFTTVKAKPGKYVFRGTELYLCMQEVLTKKFTERDGTHLSFRSFQESVQSVLNNAKDWNGKGNARKAQKNA